VPSIHLPLAHVGQYTQRLRNLGVDRGVTLVISIFLIITFRNEP
jgi:hypothetical protein